MFESEDDIFIPGGKPGTHKGFTTYLMDEKKGGQDGRKSLDRIIACVNEEFKSNPDVAGKDFNLYVTGHRWVDSCGIDAELRCAYQTPTSAWIWIYVEQSDIIL